MRRRRPPFADHASISRRWRRRARRRLRRPSSAASRDAVAARRSHGSFRKGQPDCGDVDVLVTHEDWLDDPDRTLSLEKPQSQESSLSRSSYARTRNLGDEEATEGEDPDYGAQRSRASRDKFLATLRDRLHPMDSSRTIWAVMGFRRRRRRSKGKCPARAVRRTWASASLETLTEG